MTDFDQAIEALAREGADAAGRQVVDGAATASAADLSRLAERMAASGASFADPKRPAVDIASTGGPGSLTTLMSPLAAVALGSRVSKIAVPGRPAGGIDTLGTLPGFRVDIDPIEAGQILDDCSYVHTIAGERLCKLDARFFKWRQANGAQAIPELAMASLLSKKIAAGVSRVVLDVRVGTRGNFGHDLATASINSKRFIDVAKEVGVEAICALTGLDGPAQPHIGRGEALLALDDVLTGRASGWLLDHARTCIRLAALCALDTEAGAEPSLADMLHVHEDMLASHGVSSSDYAAHLESIKRHPRVELTAKDSGVTSIDIGGLRNALVLRQRQSQATRRTAFADPCGIELRCKPGDWVPAGQVLAFVRDVRDPNTLAERLESYVHTKRGGDVKASSSSLLEVVR